MYWHLKTYHTHTQQAFVPFVASWIYCPEAPGQPGHPLDVCRSEKCCKLNGTSSRGNAEDTPEVPSLPTVETGPTDRLLAVPCSESGALAARNGLGAGEISGGNSGKESLGVFCRHVCKLLRC